MQTFLTEQTILMKKNHHFHLLLFNEGCLSSLTAFTHSHSTLFHKSAVHVSPILFCIDVLIKLYFNNSPLTDKNRGMFYTDIVMSDVSSYNL